MARLFLVHLVCLLLLFVIDVSDGRHEMSRHCLTKGHRGSKSYTLTLCSYCAVTYDHGVNVFPRRTVEFECKEDQNLHGTCLSGEGYCLQKSVVIPLRKTKPDGSTEDKDYEMMTACQCECGSESYLANFIKQ
ncbi:uncharacterized protein [Clytia hemisphaerica]|uniref:Uncharacterized protein n=2 Tax=Clytia hemisphaerica TaxID=252671 RepID=A0A7M5WR99_9CNID